MLQYHFCNCADQSFILPPKFPQRPIISPFSSSIQSNAKRPWPPTCKKPIVTRCYSSQGKMKPAHLGCKQGLLPGHDAGHKTST